MPLLVLLVALRCHGVRIEPPQELLSERVRAYWPHMLVGTIVCVQSFYILLVSELAGHPFGGFISDPVDMNFAVRRHFWSESTFDGNRSMLVYVACLVLIAPLKEELLYRGLLYHYLSSTRMGVLGAVLIANSLWAVSHWYQGAKWMVVLFCFGLFWSWLVWRSKSLWPAIIGHSMYNGCFALLMFVSRPAG